MSRFCLLPALLMHAAAATASCDYGLTVTFAEASLKHFSGDYFWDGK